MKLFLALTLLCLTVGVSTAQHKPYCYRGNCYVVPNYQPQVNYFPNVNYYVPTVNYYVPTVNYVVPAYNYNPYYNFNIPLTTYNPYCVNGVCRRW